MNKWDLVLFDIDGVLADDRHRAHYVQKDLTGKYAHPPFDAPSWSEYFRADLMAADGLWAPATALVNAFYASAKGDHIGCLTGRPETTRDATTRWLDKNRIYVDFLMMRDRKDHRSGADVKVDNLLVLSRMYNSVTFYEDKIEIVRAVQDACPANVIVKHCDWENNPNRYVVIEEKKELPKEPKSAKMERKNPVSDYVLAPELAELFD